MKKREKVFAELFSAAVIAAVAGISPASATVIDSYNFVVLDPPGINGGRPLPFSYNDGTNSLVVNASGFPDPQIYAAVTNSVLGGGGLTGADLSYSFEIFGPVTNQPLPVIFSAAMVLSAFGGYEDPTVVCPDGGIGIGDCYSSRDSWAIALADFQLPESNFTASVDCVTGGFPYPSSGILGAPTPTSQACGLSGIIAAESLYENTMYTVYMEAIAYAVSGPITLTGASAFIDPSIYIDPSFASADQYSIVLSGGIGNPTVPTVSTPEPDSVALFGTALAVLVGIIRRKRRQSRAGGYIVSSPVAL